MTQRKCLLLWLLALLGLALSGELVQAQGGPANWVFGIHGGLRFAPDGSPPLSFGPASESMEANAVASDSAGNLLCYTDGVQIWDRTHTLMPDGILTGNYFVQSATQGALLLPRPGQQQHWYLVTVDAVEYGLTDGLAYSLLDFNLRAGLGDVVPNQKNIRLAPPGLRLTEKRSSFCSWAPLRRCPGFPTSGTMA